MMPDAASRLLLGESLVMQALRARIRRAAPTLLPVLITGPTGSGKELVAQALHELSGARGRFVPLNVCAVPDSMFEATLFGHVRGAFTGANHDLTGYLGEADQGTLFLDEVGSLPLGQQGKLLRAIESKVYRPVGASGDRRASFRVLSATCESAARLVDGSALRRDLYFRLNAIHLAVPALSERREDVPILAQHFAAEIRATLARPVRLSSSALNALQHHEWSGNVRELRAMVQSCVAMAESDIVDREPIVRELADGNGGVGADSARARMLALLRQHGNDTGALASTLGVDRTTVYRRLRELGIPTPARTRRNAEGIECNAVPVS